MNLLRNILKKIAWLIISLSAVLLIGALAWLVLRINNTPPITQARVEERLNILSNVTYSARLMTDYYAWQDTEKGFVRVPVSRAKELCAEEWKNPEAARAKLMARAAVLLAVPPPPSTSLFLSNTNTPFGTNAP